MNNTHAKHCKHCNIKYTNMSSSVFANHVRWCHENPNRKTSTVLAKICPTCNTSFISKNKYCRKQCVVKTHTLEMREKISKGRIKYLLNNPDKHVWKRCNKFKSEPCELIKQHLLNRNISFVPEFSPLDTRNFSIDIAFPDKKIGIEINGNQHYTREGNLTKYYQDRHNLITEAGWNLIELHYSVAYNLDEFDNILNLKSNTDYTDFVKTMFETKEKKKLKLKQLKESKIAKRVAAKQREISIIIENLNNSNIDFTKFGWVQQASIIIGCKPQKVSTWMRKWNSEFYKTCFIRKC